MSEQLKPIRFWELISEISDMLKILRTYYKICYIFLLGVGIPASIIFLADIVLNTSMLDHLAQSRAYWSVSILFGLFSVALSVVDGQFVSEVKDSHSTNNRN